MFRTTFYQTVLCNVSSNLGLRDQVANLDTQGVFGIRSKVWNDCERRNCQPACILAY